MTDEEKKKAREWIDNANYEELLRRWRHSPSSDFILQGDIGKYYLEKMVDKRDKIGPAAHTMTSKRIGW